MHILKHKHQLKHKRKHKHKHKQDKNVFVCIQYILINVFIYSVYFYR